MATLNGKVPKLSKQPSLFEVDAMARLVPVLQGRAVALVSYRGSIGMVLILHFLRSYLRNLQRSFH